MSFQLARPFVTHYNQVPMIDFIFQPVAELLMSKGMDGIQNTAKFKHSQKAIRQAIFREMQFNQQLLNEATNN
ncbi:MAG: hypothetical protein RI556_12175, partial [Hydrogenovibrio sp.]|uniref:hypothetical protein n=1 Tax=Hydrogenovibrio sp. TaxID=2065821 RepID=UPI00286FD013